MKDIIVIDGVEYVKKQSEDNFALKEILQDLNQYDLLDVFKEEIDRRMMNTYEGYSDLMRNNGCEYKDIFTLLGIVLKNSW